MGANKFENFTIKVVNREEIVEADYNPRKITDNAFKKLKKWFAAEGKGQLAPIIVNKNSMTVVSGHQRLKVLDQLNRGKPYQLTVSLADLDEKTEVEANVFMNNSSAMGEFDFDMLRDLHDIFPEVSFTDGFGFDDADISMIFDDNEFDVEMGDTPQAEAIKNDTKKYMNTGKDENLEEDEDELNEQNMPYTKEELRAKRQQGEKQRRDQENIDDIVSRADYTFTIVCTTNEEKHDLMRKLGEKETEKYVRASKLYDIYDHKIKLRNF